MRSATARPSFAARVRGCHEPCADLAGGASVGAACSAVGGADCCWPAAVRHAAAAHTAKIEIESRSICNPRSSLCSPVTRNLQSRSGAPGGKNGDTAALRHCSRERRLREQRAIRPALTQASSIGWTSPRRTATALPRSPRAGASLPPTCGRPSACRAIDRPSQQRRASRTPAGSRSAGLRRKSKTILCIGVIT